MARADNSEPRWRKKSQFEARTDAYPTLRSLLGHCEWLVLMFCKGSFLCLFLHFSWKFNCCFPWRWIKIQLCFLFRQMQHLIFFFFLLIFRMQRAPCCEFCLWTKKSSWGNCDFVVHHFTRTHTHTYTHTTAFLNVTFVLCPAFHQINFQQQTFTLIDRYMFSQLNYKIPVTIICRTQTVVNFACRQVT